MNTGREKRKAAVEAERITKRIALELAAQTPRSPHTLPATASNPRTPSPTPDEQLARELDERTGYDGGGGMASAPRRNTSGSASASGSGSSSHMSLIEQVQQLQRQQREVKEAKASVQGQGKRPTPSKIVKLHVSPERLLEISLSPPRPSADVMLRGTPAPTALPYPRATGRPSEQQITPRAQMGSSPPQATGFEAPTALPCYREPGRLHSSPPEQQVRPRSQTQTGSSPPQAAGFQSPSLPQSHSASGRRQGQHSSPPSGGSRREPGQLHSSPPEVKLSRARAQSVSTTPQTSRHSPPFILRTPPGFPVGFNDPRTNPTVAAANRSPFPQPPPPPPTSTKLDQSRITTGFPQTEIDRVHPDPRKKKASSSKPQQATRQWAEHPQAASQAQQRALSGVNSFIAEVQSRNSSSNPQQASRQWAEHPQTASQAQQRAQFQANSSMANFQSRNSSSNPQQGSRQWALHQPAMPLAQQQVMLDVANMSTADLTRIAANAAATARAEGRELAPNPTMDQLVEIAKNSRFLIQGRVPAAQASTRTTNLAHNPTGREVSEKGKLVAAHLNAVGQSPVRVLAMPAYPQESHAERAIRTFFANVHAIPNNGQNIGVRLSHIQNANGQGPLLRRRTLTNEPTQKVLDRTDRLINVLKNQKQQASLQGAAIAPQVQQVEHVQEKDNKQNTPSANDKESWEAFMNDAWVEEDPDQPTLDELMELTGYRPLTPGPGFGPPPPEEQIDADDEKLRRYILLAATCKNVHTAGKETRESAKKPKPAERPQLVLEFSKSALARIPCAKTSPRFINEVPMFANWNQSQLIEQMDNNGCTFCLFDGDFGVYDSRVLLPAEASRGYCYECHIETAHATNKQCFDAEVPKKSKDLFDFLTEVIHDEDDEVFGWVNQPESQSALNEPTRRSLPPLKELCMELGYRDQANSFSSDPGRQKALNMLHPKTAFENAMKAAKLRNSTSPSLVQGGPVQAPIQSQGSSIGDRSSTISVDPRYIHRPGPMSPNGSVGPSQGFANPLGMAGVVAIKSPQASNVGDRIGTSPVGTRPNPRQGPMTPNGSVGPSQGFGAVPPMTSSPRPPQASNIGDRAGTPAVGTGSNPGQDPMPRNGSVSSGTGFANPLGMTGILKTKPPRPSPLSTVTEMSPMKNAASGLGIRSSSTIKQVAGIPGPSNSQSASGSGSQSNNFVGGTSGDVDTEMVLTPLTGETFNCIYIPASPTPSQQDSFGAPTPQLKNGPFPEVAPQPRRRRATLSAIDGMDISEHTTPGFCRANPYRQVDVLKAKICGNCRYEKFKICEHRHLSWKLMIEKNPARDTGDKYRRHRSCMVCPGQAMYTCAGCPLRLCPDCQTLMETQCKGWLNNLFYFYGRTHLRNDAFLLRSDGFGY
ncbi:uncharacterized protein LY89DRAFT_741710 [Mollisia scopiformis]|uniref:Uncharacterized protein n=1 Tax=Mollisia scopiformis TaxID=149040 RepID=A0A132B8Z3_MOLSC|nr:uncharacterized protein LY89DRAFT_741710 [Mollisia scopiformis]KUJ08880.1 hypothetical protein LY89DRAFT_741710 [Mollisia scopiformis]